MTTDLATQIRKVRDDNNMTQNQFASVIGVQAILVSRWERGQTQPSATNVLRIMQQFGCDIFMEDN